MIRKVLFVDDDQIMLLALHKRLEKYSDTFSMILAEDGVEAVSKLKENPVSLVVLDLKMPRMDGVSLLSHISANYPDIPVIIISGYRTQEMNRLAKEKGVIAYINKPFQIDDLAKVILSTLRKEAEGGTLHNVSPVVFLQLMEMESRTCTIRLVDRVTEQGGVLFFREGKLFDARVGRVKGLKAAYIIFTWEDVTLFIRNECSVNTNVINSSLQPIIMTAVGMKDEQDSQIPGKEDKLESQIPENEKDSQKTPEKEDSLSMSGEPGKTEQPPEIEVPPQQEVDAISEVDEPSPLDKIRNLLLREIGERCGMEDIYYDNKAAEIIHSISELGAMFNFGPLKVGYIDRGKPTDEVILPGEPSIVIKVKPKCPQDRILQVINTQM